MNERKYIHKKKHLPFISEKSFVICILVDLFVVVFSGLGQMRAEVAKKERPLLRQPVRTAGAPAASLFYV